MLKPKKEALLIKPKDIVPSSKYFEVIGAINPAAIRLPNGNILLYVRVIEKLKKYEDRDFCYSPRYAGKEDFHIVVDQFDKKDIEMSSPMDMVFKDKTKRLTFISHLRKVILSPDGFKVKSIDEEPSFYGLEWDGELGIEDPRITQIGSQFVMTYVSLSREEGISTSMALSNNCEEWLRRGIIFEEQNKDVVILPEKIGDNFYAFNRPEGNFQFTEPHIWISRSKNLEMWGKPKSIMLTNIQDAWDSGRVGAGPPPIRTKSGWLLIYHGVGDSAINEVISKKRIKYSAGAALFSLNDPSKLIAKTMEPFKSPRRKFESNPLEKKDVFFPTGIVMDKNGKDILLYAGAGDVSVTVTKLSLNHLLASLKKIK